MIVLSNLAQVVIEPGAAVPFNRLVQKSGCGECWNRQLPNSVKMKAHGGIYELEFTGNVASATAGVPLQLSIAVGGQPLIETTMISTPSAADTFNNVHASTRFSGCCCDLDRVTVINSGTNPVTLAANSALVVQRNA